MSQEQLRRAYNLIQGERLDEATEIIRRVLSSDPDNADAWWLLANAVTEPSDAAEALGNVLRLNPGHTEARAVYDELIMEYPDLVADTSGYAGAYDSSFDEGFDSPNAFDALAGYDAPTMYGERTEYNLTAAPPSSSSMESFTEESLDNPALNDLFGSGSDIDSLLSQAPSGPIQPRAAAADTSADWMQASGTPADINDIDLDSMFGGAQLDVPATATEERDLDEMFFGNQQQAAPAKDESLEGILDSFEATVPTKAIRDRRETGSAPPQTAPEADMELDALFSDPGFVKDLDKEEGKGRRGRKRRRKEQEQAAEFFMEPEPEPQPAAKVEQLPKTRTQERPVRVSMPEQFDPFQAETRINRRNPLFTVISFLAVAAIVAAAAFLIPRFLQPDPIALAVQNAQANLTSAGFTAVRAESAGSTFRVTVCSTPGRALQGKVYEAMDAVADSIGEAVSAVQSAQIVVTDCADTIRILYRASAPVTAITSYIQGQKRDVRGYRAAWR